MYHYLYINADKNGIQDMNLADIVEMICDWYAASKRHNDGNIFTSILLNKDRFNYTAETAEILRNTVYYFCGNELDIGNKNA